MIIEYAVLSLALNPCKHMKSFMKVFMVLRIHAWETNTHARVNLYEVSIYKSCWRWSVSQFSTCMRLLRHGCQRHSFGNSQADGQMYIHVHFPWPHWSELMNWQFVQIMASKFRSKLCVLETDDVKQKTSLFSGFFREKSACYCFLVFVVLFYIVCVRINEWRNHVEILYKFG